MTTPESDKIARLLMAWGDRAALERLTPLVYGELRRSHVAVHGTDQRGLRPAD